MGQVADFCKPAFRSRAFRPGYMRLPFGCAEANDQRQDESTCKERECWISSNELGSPVTERVWSRLDRQSLQMAFDIFREIVDGRVTALDFAVECAKEDVIEIALQVPAELVWLRAAGVRDL